MMDTDGLPDGIYRFGAVAVDYFYRFAGDTDGNRTINEMDELRVQSSWLKHAGQPGFDANADLNSDGVVNFLDLQLVRSNWMRTLGF